MDLTSDERHLLAAYRTLSAEGQKELLDHAVMLVEKLRPSANATTSGSAGQCRIGREEARPEAVEEPIFTE